MRGEGVGVERWVDVRGVLRPDDHVGLRHGAGRDVLGQLMGGLEVAAQHRLALAEGVHPGARHVALHDGDGDADVLRSASGIASPLSTMHDGADARRAPGRSTLSASGGPTATSSRAAAQDQRANAQQRHAADRGPAAVGASTWREAEPAPGEATERDPVRGAPRPPTHQRGYPERPAREPDAAVLRHRRGRAGERSADSTDDQQPGVGADHPQPGHQQPEEDHPEDRPPTRAPRRSDRPPGCPGRRRPAGRRPRAAPATRSNGGNARTRATGRPASMRARRTGGDRRTASRADPRRQRSPMTVTRSPSERPWAAGRRWCRSPQTARSVRRAPRRPTRRGPGGHDRPRGR